MSGSIGGAEGEGRRKSIVFKCKNMIKIPKYTTTAKNNRPTHPPTMRACTGGSTAPPPSPSPRDRGRAAPRSAAGPPVCGVSDLVRCTSTCSFLFI